MEEREESEEGRESWSRRERKEERGGKEGRRGREKEGEIRKMGGEKVGKTEKELQKGCGGGGGENLNTGHCDLRVTSVYLPWVSPGAHLFTTQRGKTNS